MQPEPGDSPASISPPKASPPPLDSVAGSKAAPSYAPEPADISPEPSDDVMDSSATELFATTKRSRLQGTQPKSEFHSSSLGLPAIPPIPSTSPSFFIANLQPSPLKDSVLTGRGSQPSSPKDI
ncbi:hypothetical protein SAY87_028227 [Trapa incisa]|uniref:Uncharacterized protein n=1 Tax=Trapa incisa TaxID=236973 RepID=A0AAN7QRE6_9MYRT|nr:hypothetical protein SAY87_028227 [Trapa incisa]